jgi:DtxR family Mn-dependent transcriptional regulator
MFNHNTSVMSESEEMYLITIARLAEQGIQTPIPISRLASELDIQPVSANQMVHKLDEDGLVTYTPYRGVELTPEGSQVTSAVLRRRRLWEVFLVDQLGIVPNEADALACRLEHITPRMVIDRLDDFLSHPAFSPQGLPIPSADREETEESLLPLSQIPVGQEQLVAGLRADEVTCAFLEAEGLRAGAVIRPLAISDCGAMLLRVGENRIHLASELAGDVMVATGSKTVLISEEN